MAHQRDVAHAALRISNVERGRALGLAGNMVLAEQVIWREYISRAGLAVSATVDPIDPLTQPDHAYWALWELYASFPCLHTTGDPNNGRVSSIALSADGTTLASTGNSGAITLFEFPSGRLRGQLGERRETHESPGQSVLPKRYWPTISFSPDGRTIAVGSLRKAVQIWDVATRTCVATFNGKTGESTSKVGSEDPTTFHVVLFSPDGRMLASSSNEPSIRLWDVASRTCIRVLEGHTDDVRGMSFSPFGKTLLSGGIGGDVMLWDVATGEAVAVLDDPNGKMYAVRFSPDGRWFATAGDDLAIRVWETASRRCIQVLTGHAAWVRALDFHPHANVLATGGADKSIILWDIPTGRALRRLAGHGREILAVQFSPGGRMLASADLDCIKFWDLTDSGCYRKLVELPGTVFTVSFMPDSRTVAYGRAYGDMTVRLCDRSTGKTVQILRGHTAPVSAIAVSPDGSLLASASYDRTVRLWDLVTGSCKHVLTGHQNGINSISIRPDGRTLASASDDGTVRIWELPSGRHLSTLDQGSTRIPSICFSPDGRTLAASSGYEGEIVLWNTESQRIRHRWRAHDAGVRPVRFSHDGTILASGGDDNHIKLWEIDSGSHVATLRGHDQDIFCLDFAPNDHMLASGGRGDSIKLWDVTQHKCLVTLEGHRDMVFSVQFSADGERLLSTGRDGVVGLWDLRYYNRNIAGNRAYHHSRLAASGESSIFTQKE